MSRVGTLLSEVEPEEPGWLWQNWVPIKCVTFLVGMPGVGKSTVLADLAARVTRDDVMPDGSLCGAPGGVVLIGLEEMIAEVVVPRIIAAGGRRDMMIDLSNVERAGEGKVGEMSKAPFDITKDLGALKEAILQVNATLVIIDPFMAAMSAKARMWANGPANDAFMALQRAAAKLGVAILVINHFSKRRRTGDDVDLLENMLGGAVLGQRTRSAMLLAKDEADPRQAILSQLKHSMAPQVIPIVLKHDGKHVDYLTGLTPDREAMQEATVASEAGKKVLAILKDAPDKSFTPQFLAQTCGPIEYDTMKSILRRMANRGQIERVERGFYRALPAPAPSAKKGH